MTLAAVLAAATGQAVEIAGRVLLQSRGSGDVGRIVERVTLRSGRAIIVKCRNDRPTCRETLFYRHVLHRASGLVPRYLGSSTTDAGVHALLLEHLPGHPAEAHHAADRRAAMAALAALHGQFPGDTVTAVLGAGSPEELRAEASPDPTERTDLVHSYVQRVAATRPTLGPEADARARQEADRIAAAIADSPLILDPGDVRPENVIVRDGRAWLIDFENIAVRRLGLALASMLEHWPDPDGLLALYAAAHRAAGAPGELAILRRWAAAGRAWIDAPQRARQS